MRHLFARLGIGAAGLVLSSSAASAHEFGHGGLSHGEASAAFVIVLGLPVLAGLVGGVVIIRYPGLEPSEPDDGVSSIAVGLLVVGLGAASLLPAVRGHLWLSAAGGSIGAVTALWVENSKMVPGASCENHARLTLGAISTHRLLEGVAMGMLYLAGAAVGVVGAVVLAGHALIETAAVGGLYATARGRIWTVSAIVLVQVSYVVGAVVGLGVVEAFPTWSRAFSLAVVGGILLVVGAGATERSITAGRPALGE